ncbi:MAG TPA: thermonuclease family protein, partial [Anaerolineales bacterium]|nr:thermonuclease family protein [Anaerolineales bacterium]
PMPLSARRSYRKRPTSSPNQSEQAAVADVRQTKPEANAPEIRPAQHPRAILIGGGLALGLLILVALMNTHERLGGLPQDTPREATAVSTRAMGSGLALELASPVSASPTGPATSKPNENPAPVNGISSSNPWTGSIPEAACIPADLPETGRVVEVLNGDTIKVLMDRDGRVYSVRYLGVKAPRLSVAAALGRLALERNLELVYRQRVVLVRDISDADPSGTRLRYVMAKDVFVNQMLIRDGWGEVEMSTPDTACLEAFRAAEQQAQLERRGIWGSGAVPTVTP